MVAPEPAPLGAQIRSWREARGVTQLQLAAAAGTTSRHLSFVENGRSWPGPELVSRLANELGVPAQAQRLLVGLAAHEPASGGAVDSHAPRDDDEAALAELIATCEPFPACVVDSAGVVRQANATYQRLAPGVLDMSPEEQVDRFFGDQGRRWIVNWSEVASAEANRRVCTSQSRASAAGLRLGLRALHYVDALGSEARPQGRRPIVELRVGNGQVVSVKTVTLVPQVDTGDPTGEVVEISIPADTSSLDWFERTHGR